MTALQTTLAIVPVVAALAGVLIVAGLGLSVLTWWFWVTAKPESVVLAPLEMMSDRRYAKASEAEREQMVGSVRDLVTLEPRRARRRQFHPNMQVPKPADEPSPTASSTIDPLLK